MSTATPCIQPIQAQRSLLMIRSAVGRPAGGTKRTSPSSSGRGLSAM